MASYAMAHLKLVTIIETGYKPTTNQIQSLLTNSLEHHQTQDFLQLVEHRNETNHIKRDTPVCV